VSDLRAEHPLFFAHVSSFRRDISQDGKEGKREREKERKRKREIRGKEGREKGVVSHVLGEGLGNADVIAVVDEHAKGGGILVGVTRREALVGGVDEGRVAWKGAGGKQNRSEKFEAQTRRGKLSTCFHRACQTTHTHTHTHTT
jgi:hypothetical protein